jgi:hypothetical protein
MTEHNMRHLDFIRAVAEEDLRFVDVKDRQYGGSWKRRGGVGAFMMLARKWDRLENELSKDGTSGENAAPPYDIFARIERDAAFERRYPDASHMANGADGTVLAEVRDLRRYCMLVEAELMARGAVPMPTPPDKDAVRHAGRESSEPLLTAKDDPVVRHLDQYAEPVISEGKIYERDRPPRWLVRDKDDEVLDVGDPVTVARPGEKTGEGVVVALHSCNCADVKISGVGTMIVPGDWLRLDQTRQRVAVTNTPRAGESEAQIQARERRVPRFDGAKPEAKALPDNACPPWIVGSGFAVRKNIERELFDKFWTKRAPEVYILEPHVVSDNIPRLLRPIYLSRGEGWILNIESCPTEARGMFPVLRPEYNMTEHEALPAWQRPLYTWCETRVKFEIADTSRAWTLEDAA